MGTRHCCRALTYIMKQAALCLSFYNTEKHLQGSFVCLVRNGPAWGCSQKEPQLNDNPWSFCWGLHVWPGGIHQPVRRMWCLGSFGSFQTCRQTAGEAGWQDAGGMGGICSLWCVLLFAVSPWVNLCWCTPEHISITCRLGRASRMKIWNIITPFWR